MKTILKICKRNPAVITWISWYKRVWDWSRIWGKRLCGSLQ